MADKDCSSQRRSSWITAKGLVLIIHSCKFTSGWLASGVVIANQCVVENLRALQPTQTVLKLGNSLKVHWVHTRPVPAQMVNDQAFRNLPDVMLIRESMGANVLVPHSEQPISVIRACASPHPTLALNAHLAGESLKRVGGAA